MYRLSNNFSSPVLRWERFDRWDTLDILDISDGTYDKFDLCVVLEILDGSISNSSPNNVIFDIAYIQPSPKIS